MQLLLINNRKGKGVIIEDKALLSVKDMCNYMGIGENTARNLLNKPHNAFTVRIGGRIFAHKQKLDKWLLQQVDM